MTLKIFLVPLTATAFLKQKSPTLAEDQIPVVMCKVTLLRKHFLKYFIDHMLHMISDL